MSFFSNTNKFSVGSWIDAARRQTKNMGTASTCWHVGHYTIEAVAEIIITETLLKINEKLLETGHDGCSTICNFSRY